MNLQKNNSIILKTCLVNTLWPSVEAYPVKAYECPLTNKTIVEQILSVSNEDLNKPITNNTQLEISKKSIYKSALKDSPEFEIYKSAITVIREKVFKQLDATETANELKVAKIKNSLINLNNSNNSTPKTFSYAKLSLNNSEVKSYELYSISGEFQIINTPGDKKIFASYDESGNQKLNYFAPPENDYGGKILKEIEKIKNKIKSLEEEINRFEELSQKKPKDSDSFKDKALLSKKKKSELEKELEDLKLRSEENIIINEIEKTHGKRISPESKGRIRDSDSEALILEKILTLTKPKEKTQLNNMLYAFLSNANIYHHKEINDIKEIKTLNIQDLNQEVSGTLKIYTSFQTCPSCKNIYVLFSILRPNIKLEITTASNEIREYIYTNDFNIKN